MINFFYKTKILPLELKGTVGQLVHYFIIRPSLLAHDLQILLALFNKNACHRRQGLLNCFTLHDDAN
jgi:hypothetical protein